MMSILRQVEVKDYAPIIQVIDDWWGGRPMAGMLHRLFFEHFQPTSFVIGPAEGHLNHLKLLKRQSYGRVGLESSSQRLLAT